jgi:PAS domain S-box-containing protein
LAKQHTFNQLVEMNKNDQTMDELNKLRKKLKELEEQNRLFQDTKEKLQAINQQLKASEQQLKAKHETLEITQRIARVGSWEWDIATDTVSWTDEMYRIFRWNPAKGAVSYADHPKIYTPKSMELLDAAVQHTLKTTEPYEIDLEIIRGDGTHGFCTAWGYAQKDETGKVIGLYGSFQDITQRKTEEEKLRESEEKLRLILDNNPFPTAVVDETDQNILFWSTSAIQLFGHRPKTTEEWYQQAYPDPAYRQEVIERWKPFLVLARQSNEAIDTGEYEIRCKDGNTKICELYVQFMPGSLIVTLNDITERKKSEEELKKIEWLLRSKNKKTQADTPAYGDLTQLNKDGRILNAVGKDVLHDIVGDYLSLLETSAAVYEKNGDYAVGIFSSEWCQFLDCTSRDLCKCNDNSMALESGKWLCHESCRADASLQSIQNKQAVDIECSGGLHIYALPIIANNEVIGSINFGYGNPPTDESKLSDIAAKYQVPKAKLKKLAHSYETRPAFIIDIAKEKLETSAKLIGTIVERKQLEKELLKNQSGNTISQQKHSGVLMRPGLFMASNLPLNA